MYIEVLNIIRDMPICYIRICATITPLKIFFQHFRPDVGIIRKIIHTADTYFSIFSGKNIYNVILDSNIFTIHVYIYFREEFQLS
jgi:hypothetical protein